jgi:hypothetical protein
MRLGIGAILSLIAIGCAGCASQPAAPIVAAVAPGQAKITITRTDTPACIAGCAVQIDVNGNHLTELAPGQSFTGGVPAGTVTLTAWQALDIGQYKLEFKAVPGKTYAFEVSPRTAHKVAAIVGGLSGLFIETVASGEHSGGFEITPVQ